MATKQSLCKIFTARKNVLLILIYFAKFYNFTYLYRVNLPNLDSFQCNLSNCVKFWYKSKCHVLPYFNLFFFLALKSFYCKKDTTKMWINYIFVSIYKEKIEEEENIGSWTLSSVWMTGVEGESQKRERKLNQLIIICITILACILSHY